MLSASRVSTTNPSRRFVASLAALLALDATLSMSRPAEAGPTISADLDLGTSVGRDTFGPRFVQGTGMNAFGVPVPVQQAAGVMVVPADPRQFSKLYVVGFRVRAGWRFDIGPLFLLPELGGGYDVERFIGAPTMGLPRVFGGARAGLSFPLAPLVRLEPAVYGHVGYARYSVPDDGTGQDGIANDVGVSLDLRLLRLLTVGAHVGYDVVTTWASPPATTFGGTPSSSGTFALADRLVGYGVHAGVLFW